MRRFVLAPILLVTLAIAGCDDTPSQTERTDALAAEYNRKFMAPKPNRPAASKPQRNQPPPDRPNLDKFVIRSELDGVTVPGGDPNIKNVFLRPGRLKVVVATPEGGFEGPSTKDMDRQVAEMLRAVYLNAGFEGGTEVRFIGGLIDMKTGRDVPNALTGRYTIAPGEARQINWADGDLVSYLIDWSLYRSYVHPAIKD